MDNIKVINGQWHVKSGKTWCMRSNFIFRILYEVQHPQDSIYVVDITTDQGLSGEAYFKAGDLHNPKEFQVTLNRTFKQANLLCYFKQTELLKVVSTLSAEARLQGSVRKCMISNAGLQQGTPFVFLSPSQILDLRSGNLDNPSENPYVWLTDPLLKGPKADLTREIQLPPSSASLGIFLDLAVDKLGVNVGAAILSWSAMYALQLYRKWMSDVRHVNLPVLYGPPTAGKTTIAQCGAWLNGCSDKHIASRCTLAFVTQWITTCSVPFVWDDPTTSEEVAQLAVDLGNGAVRGKATEDPKTPLTGCLVTANFDLSCLLKYFSRLFVMKVEKLPRRKQTGEAKALEDAASEASSALPMVLNALNKINMTEIQEAVQAVDFDADIRILEGIAVPVVCAEKILRVAQREEYMENVHAYVKETLIPYYKNSLEECSKTPETVPPLPRDISITEIADTIIASAHQIDDVCLVKGSVIAVRSKVIPPQMLKKFSSVGRTNQTARFQGKTKKCVTIQKEQFESEDWSRIVRAVNGLDEVEESCPSSPGTDSSGSSRSASPVSLPESSISLEPSQQRSSHELHAKSDETTKSKERVRPSVSPVSLAESSISSEPSQQRSSHEPHAKSDETTKSKERVRPSASPVSLAESSISSEPSQQSSTPELHAKSDETTKSKERVRPSASPVSLAESSISSEPSQQSSTPELHAKSDKTTKSKERVRPSASPVSLAESSISSEPSQQSSTPELHAKSDETTKSKERVRPSASPVSLAEPSISSEPSQQSSTPELHAKSDETTKSKERVRPSASPVSLPEPSISSEPSQQRSTPELHAKSNETTKSKERVRPSASPVSLPEPSISSEPSQQSSTPELHAKSDETTKSKERVRPSASPVSLPEPSISSEPSQQRFTPELHAKSDETTKSKERVRPSASPVSMAESSISLEPSQQRSSHEPHAKSDETMKSKERVRPSASPVSLEEESISSEPSQEISSTVPNYKTMAPTSKGLRGRIHSIPTTPAPFPRPKRAESKITCGTCKKVGRGGMNWVCCDGCDAWHHQKCTMPLHKFRALGDKEWFCPPCRNSS